MGTRFCCDGMCNQGRDCPARKCAPMAMFNKDLQDIEAEANSAGNLILSIVAVALGGVVIGLMIGFGV
jgi:hypothetical protein